MQSKKVHCTCKGTENDYIMVGHGFGLRGRIFVGITEGDRVCQVVLTPERAKKLRKHLKEAIGEAK